MEKNERITIPAYALEFNAEGNTIWVQGENGTILRIKCTGKIITDQCKDSPGSHSDIIINGDINFCVSTDRINNV